MQLHEHRLITYICLSKHKTLYPFPLFHANETQRLSNNSATEHPTSRQRHWYDIHVTDGLDQQQQTKVDILNTGRC